MARVREAWPQVRIEMLDSKLPVEIQMGESVVFQARVKPGLLTHEDLRVELYAGRLDADGEIVEPVITEMKLAGSERDSYLYEVSAIPCCSSGRHGYTARVLPRHPNLRHSFVPGLITWSS
jgi:starch phosphorylase